MERKEALTLIEQNISNQNLIKHSLAAEAIMRALARHFNEDEETWGLAGLLHDIDYDSTKDDPARHSLEGSRQLAALGLGEEIVNAVLVHNEYHGKPRQTRLEKALHAVDPLTGLITAAALIRKEKSLWAVGTDFVVNRFYEKGFARGAKRDQISQCVELGLTLEEFIAIGLSAMQGISNDLGL